MNFRKIFIISLCVVVGIVAIAGGAVYFVGHDLYSSVNYVADDSIEVAETLPEEAEEETDEGIGDLVSADELEAIQKAMASSRNVLSDEDVYNVLLVGVDRQERTWNGNSDAMMLVSINSEEKRITMVSLMRDIYVNIPDVGYKKLNAAYAYGGGPLLCQTVTDNFRVEVDKYIAVDFWDLVEVIDIIGGIDMEITPEEAEVANGYIMDLCQRQLEIDPEPHYFPEEGGLVHADGVQAVSYARNRFVGNSDFQRTERQRYIIEQIMAEVQNMSIAQMTADLQDILEYVTTNIPESDIWGMLSDVPEMLTYDFEESRIPYDGMYSTILVNGQDMLVPDWDETLTLLHDFIYNYDQYLEETDTETAVDSSGSETETAPAADTGE